MDYTAKLQALLDAAERDIYLTDGIYEISNTLIIHSNTRIRLSDNAVIRLADGAGCTMLKNDMCEKDGYNYNITIEGGIWDGNNENQPKRGKRGDKTPYFIGHIMIMDGVENLKIRDVTYKNPSCYAMQLINIDRFTVENITFDYNFRNVNMDGVHIQGPAKNGYIKNIKGATNDDLVALNCNDCYKTWEKEDVTSGDIENIVIEGLFAENGYTGVRLLSCGNKLRNISIKNIFGTYRFHGISFTHHNIIPGAPVWIDNVDISGVYCSKPPQTEPFDIRPVQSVDGEWGEGVHADGIENCAVILFAKGVKCGNISISHLHRTESAITKAPTIEIEEDATIDNLCLFDISQNFENASGRELIVNNGTVNFLYKNIL